MDARSLRIAVYYGLGAAVPSALLFYIMGRMTLATPLFILAGGLLVGYRAYKIEVRAKARRRLLAAEALDNDEAIDAPQQKAA